MRIGLDFDNTIVNYDDVFDLVAREGGHIPAGLPRGKLRVRDYLRGAGREDIWTEIQGYVYGARMRDAAPYPGAVDFMRWANDAGHELRIISHKTRHPYLGTKYDLHASAHAWIGQVLHDGGRPLVAPEHVFFDLTKNEKLKRVDGEACDVFVDDLPEILLAPEFPGRVRRFLFDPDSHHKELTDVIPVTSWGEVRAHLEAACVTPR
jgi:hypothetical protein